MPTPELMSDETGPRKERFGRMLDKLGLHRPELRAWAMYDWANSAMVTTIITAVFPIYYANVACKGVFNLDEARRRYATATVIGMVIIALLSPVLGTIADLKGDKKKMLGGFLALGVFSVAGMFFIYKGDWLLASILFILANIGGQRQLCVLRRAIAPRCRVKTKIDRVSTAGYALGYIGGGTSAGAQPGLDHEARVVRSPAVGGFSAQGTLPTRLAFLSVAVWWLVFSIPLFSRVQRAGRRAATGEQSAFPIRAAFARLWETARACAATGKPF